MWSVDAQNNRPIVGCLPYVCSHFFVWVSSYRPVPVLVPVHGVSGRFVWTVKAVKAKPRRRSAMDTGFFLLHEWSVKSGCLCLISSGPSRGMQHEHSSRSVRTSVYVPVLLLTTRLGGTNSIVFDNSPSRLDRPAASTFATVLIGNHSISTGINEPEDPKNTVSKNAVPVGMIPVSVPVYRYIPADTIVANSWTFVDGK